MGGMKYKAIIDVGFPVHTTPRRWRWLVRVDVELFRFLFRRNYKYRIVGLQSPRPRGIVFLCRKPNKPLPATG